MSLGLMPLHTSTGQGGPGGGSQLNRHSSLSSYLSVSLRSPHPFLSRLTPDDERGALREIFFALVHHQATYSHA
eukprot:364354-Chlamydomonas_euryale.AAC.9